VSSAAFFTSSPACPYENAVNARRAAAIVRDNFKDSFVFIYSSREIAEFSAASL
jgi:hypothetical protein